MGEPSELPIEALGIDAGGEIDPSHFGAEGAARRFDRDSFVGGRCHCGVSGAFDRLARKTFSSVLQTVSAIIS
jgi:hypothetical protein